MMIICLASVHFSTEFWLRDAKFCLLNIMMTNADSSVKFILLLMCFLFFCSARASCLASFKEINQTPFCMVLLTTARKFAGMKIFIPR